ncbi:hypothetical protein CDD82_3731 [Ophiocordyceps australis]|uniref:SWR1-complex protein 5 n=1 Tax=Ophiocordyceps australis TaxID=1399860 RepID=A0A2C5ZAE0_9HYPO|nr:hypothetical protein CDD82_3731 [Ophiocordyceps australis]
MPSDLIENDNDHDQYISSEDSDFAPDDTHEQASTQSDSDKEAPEPSNKQRLKGDNQGYDNSGDETIIKKGHKRRKRAQQKGETSDGQDGSPSGLIKTRRQRAHERAERHHLVHNGPVAVDVDALWQQMISGQPRSPGSNKVSVTNKGTNAAIEHQVAEPKFDAPDTVHIKRTFNFAGRIHTEEKVVARDSAEAKLFLASQATDTSAQTSPAKRATKKAFRSRFEPVIDDGSGRTDLDLSLAARTNAAKEAQAQKLNTVEKSRMDWAGYVDKEGIKDELQLASKAKDSYNSREDFLARSEAVRQEEVRRARMAGRT